MILNFGKLSIMSELMSGRFSAATITLNNKTLNFSVTEISLLRATGQTPCPLNDTARVHSTAVLNLGLVIFLMRFLVEETTILCLKKPL